MNSENTQTNIASQDAIEEKIRSYLDTYPTALQELNKFLEYRRENETPQVLIPLVELETRLELINDIVKKQREVRKTGDWMLNKIQFSYLLRMSLSDLRGFSGFDWAAELVLNGLGKATRHFLQLGRFVPTGKSKSTGKGEANDKESLTNQSLTNQSGMSNKRGHEEMNVPVEEPKTVGSTTNTKKTKPVKNKIDRNRHTITGCLGFDEDTCVITGLRNPTVAHIVPFAWNSSDDNRAVTETLRYTLRHLSSDFKGEHPDRGFIEFYETKGVSDKTWNVISICHDLHSLWGYGIWALKWQGSIELENNPSRSRITLQFHWMPRNIKMDDKKYSPLQKLVPEEITVDGVMALQDELKHMYGGEQHSCPNRNCKTCLEVANIGARDYKSGQPIKTGDIFTIIRPTEDIEKCKKAFDIQWAIINAAAISGRASVTDDPDDDSDGRIEVFCAERGELNLDEIEFDSEDDNSQQRTEDWVMGQGSGSG